VTDSLERAAGLLAGGGVVGLTGAGLSTDSGIPDYRGPTAVPRSPMTYQEFIAGDTAQRRYWARSHVGWARLGHAAPNDGHRALADLGRRGVLTGLITQNVDGLHRAAGSPEVVDLHGRIADVVCLKCGDISARATLQQRLARLNPGFAVPADAPRAAPDGDADVEPTAEFRIAPCLVCGGPLKPDVVFFGENVPAARVSRCYAQVEAARVLLVAGTSLMVQSGLRFVRRAHREGIPVILVNRGPTRGDDLVALRLEGGCTELLRNLTELLSSPVTEISPRSP
jgi:NAD-dependent SIR2 family protein deacetylase